MRLARMGMRLLNGFSPYKYYLDFCDKNEKQTSFRYLWRYISYYIDDSLKSDKLSRAVLNFFFFRVLFIFI